MSSFDYSKYEAVPTSFEGVSYRSRLEARWAHFFSSTGYDFRYEYKTFKGPTFYYTPDFWVNIDGHLLIVEVKPSGYDSTDDDRFKWQWMHDTLDETVSFEAEFAVIYGMPYLNREHACRMKRPGGVFSLHYRELPESLDLMKWRSNYREAARYVFED